MTRFLETKEQMGGFWIIEAADLDVAPASARAVSAQVAPCWSKAWSGLHHALALPAAAVTLASVP